MSELFASYNLKFLAQGLWTTIYLAFIIIVLSTIFGMILAVMRNSKNTVLKLIASIYIEFVRNVPNLLWIFIVFLIFQLQATSAGITAFTIFTSAALAEIIRGGLNAIDHGQTEAGLSQGLTQFQVLRIIVLPQAIRKMLPSIISQFVTVVKDTSFLYSVIALQDLFGKSQILMGKYFETSQIFALYFTITALYFLINFSISSYSRHLSKKWERAAE
ncbi:amino acid ABC transporter permease [Streptococcus criceti]|uniref:Glutamine ABC transporter, permease protein GlnP n=1 Tax=Streptococcus criceti HS-6 TaxID=873449 RepID=G5JSR1_STRCG|nr:amino acid ABC transporter permease [Streptococcus criceti]EHI73428.1 putative glutamine ABC transporter, permease protein GlnP [Streptococcus criceti HS-6]SUN37540.1 amino acid ABC transporter permease [Streptococcus criceti]